MRFLRLPLLLLLFLPGLVLPAGLLLRICLCEHEGGRAGANCCAPAAPEAPGRSCCSGARELASADTEEAGSDDAPADGALRADTCRCLLLQIEEELPDAERPRAELEFALAPSSAAERAAPFPAVEPPRRRGSPRPLVRPPPDHQRTLPLLL
ncbi:MAG: hypothetical protein JNM84_28295 [Planctomycetes bacterium]|nr:hypothetical protein [Planctomycetota bacterium]